MMKGRCNVIGLLCNNKDAVYYYTSFLTIYIHDCFCMNMFETNCTTYDLQIIYTTGMPMGMGNYIMTYDLIGQCYYTHMCTCLQLYISEGNTELLSLHPLPLTKDTLSTEALTLSTATMHDVSNVLIICVYASTMIGSGNTQEDMI